MLLVPYSFRLYGMVLAVPPFTRSYDVQRNCSHVLASASYTIALQLSSEAPAASQRLMHAPTVVILDAGLGLTPADCVHPVVEKVVPMAPATEYSVLPPFATVDDTTASSYER